jgi:hypothetical protein
MRQTTKDNLIYVGVGLIVAAGLTIYIFYTERTTGRIQEIRGPILWGILSTPGIVALIFERFWQFRRRLLLWVISIIAAPINVLAMFVAYSFPWNPPAIVWSGMTVLWVIIVFIVAQKFLTRDRNE